MLTALLLCATLLYSYTAAFSQSEIIIYRGMCDASAALAIDEQHFIVANDEDNTLRIYNVDEEFPVYQIDMSQFLRIQYDDKSPEADFEGAARAGDIYFFITSHGRDKEGRMRRNRHRFFALQIYKHGQDFQVNTIGKAYEFLMDYLAEIPQLKKHLAEAYDRFDDKDKDLAPKAQGVNIEGLAVNRTGNGLLIGFRNPLPGNNALVVEFLNPLNVLAGSEQPKFGQNFLLNLDFRGVRSLEYFAERDQYLLVAGDVNGDLPFQLYFWDGNTENVEKVSGANFEDYKKFNPEAFILFQQNKTLLMLSDDGTVNIRDTDGELCDCKKLSDDSLKQFRGLWFPRDKLQAQ